MDHEDGDGYGAGLDGGVDGDSRGGWGRPPEVIPAAFPPSDLLRRQPSITTPQHCIHDSKISRENSFRRQKVSLCLSPKVQSGKPFPDQLNFADQQFDGYGVSSPTNVFFPNRHFYSDGHFMPTDSQTVLSLPTNFSLVLTLQFPTNYLVLFIFPTNFGIVFFFLKRCFAFPNDI